MIRSPQYLSTLLLAGTLLVASCSRSGPDDPPEPNKPTLTLRTTLTAFAAGGDDAEFSFATNRSWHIDRELSVGDTGDWLTVTPERGEAGEQIAVTVTVEPNEEYTGRSCTLLLSTEPNEAGTVLEERIVVEQRKKNVILLGENRIEVTSDKQPLSVSVQSNVAYTVAVKEGGDWIEELPESRAAEGLEEKVHRFDIAANSDAEERTGVIVFTDTDSELSDELTVVQAAWDDPDPERTALKALYDAGGGSGWTRSDNWCSDKPLGEWYGVETNIEGHVTALRLPKNNLTGTISEKIASLVHLQHLDLSWNALEGDLTFKMGGNDIRSNLDDLLSLESIDLSHNRLTGEFMPTHWYKITGLQQINLSSNLLKGYAIPIQWAPMFENGRMVDLILNDNYLYGDIPISIQTHHKWDIMALQMIRQRSKDGSLNEMEHEKDIHLPDFTFTDLRNGSQRPIREVYGANKLTMLLAWDPTQEDSKTFAETIVRRFHTLFSGQGFGVVAILPEGEAYRQAAEEYLRTHEVPWPVVSEYADAAGERLILPSYPYPSYLLVDQTGKVTHDMFDGQSYDWVVGEPRTMDMLSFRQSDWLSGLFSQTLGKSKYQSTDFSKDKQYETLQTATRGKGIDIVLVGEAFTDIDIETGFYRQVMEYAMESFFALEPTKSYREYFNIYMVYAVSRDTHIGKFGSDVRTALEIRKSDNGSVETYSYVLPDYMRACPIRSSYDTSVGIVIHDNNAGITSYNRPGPSNAFCGYPLGGRTTMRQNLLHELVGHGVGWLGDEYAHLFSGEITESAKRRLQTDQRQGYFLNLSLTSDTSQVPWSHLAGHPRYPYVGAFEGGNYYNRGVWRSEEGSTMVSIFTEYFNAASRELIVKRIMKLAGEEYTFEKFLAKDSDAGRPWAQSATKSVKPRRTDYVHHPPVFVDEL